MKRCILSDLHSRDPQDFIRDLQGVDAWAFLGDYDDPRILKNILAMKDRIITIGNHEYALANGQGIISQYVIGIEEELYRLWEEHEYEKEFVLDCIEDIDGEQVGVRVEKEDKFGKVLYTHSALSSTVYDSLRARIFPRGRRDRTESRDNFRAMKTRGINLMFRGHDHFQRIVSQDGEEIKEEKFRVGQPFELDPSKRYIVSVGAFVEKNYTIYNEDRGYIILK